MTEIVRTLSDIHLTTPTVLTIGSFDGLHRGHQRLIQTVMDHARKGRCERGGDFEPASQDRAAPRHAVPTA